MACIARIFACVPTFCTSCNSIRPEKTRVGARSLAFTRAYEWRLVACVRRLHNQNLVVNFEAVRDEKRIVFKTERRRQA